MKDEVKHVRGKQILSWVVLAIFVAGFFSPVGMWTGPILGAWLVGTQRVRRGFVRGFGASCRVDSGRDKHPL